MPRHRCRRPGRRGHRARHRRPRRSAPSPETAWSRSPGTSALAGPPSCSGRRVSASRRSSTPCSGTERQATAPSAPTTDGAATRRPIASSSRSRRGAAHRHARDPLARAAGGDGGVSRRRSATSRSWPRAVASPTVATARAGLRGPDGARRRLARRGPLDGLSEARARGGPRPRSIRSPGPRGGATTVGDHPSLGQRAHEAEVRRGLTMTGTTIDRPLVGSGAPVSLPGAGRSRVSSSATGGMPPISRRSWPWSTRPGPPMASRSARPSSTRRTSSGSSTATTSLGTCCSSRSTGRSSAGPG